MAFWVGLFAFGGGFAIISQIKQRVVDDRRWLSNSEFAETVGVVAALPGTNATNLLTIIGARLGGPLIGAVAAVLFVLPGLAMILGLAINYERMRSLPGLGGALEGITAAVVGIVAAVADELRPSVVKRRREAVLVALAFVALVTHVLTLLEVVALAGLFGLLDSRAARGRSTSPFFLVAAPVVAESAGLFTAFAKIALATFGGGVAMLPAVEREVAARGWVSASVYADAVAFAQITPGPIANCATFIGYRVAGIYGAFAATAGVFIPPLILCLVVAKPVALLRDKLLVRGFLHGVSIAVVGAIAAASYSVYRAGVHGAVLTGLAIAIFVWRRWRPRHNTVVAILVGGLFGFVRTWLFG